MKKIWLMISAVLIFVFSSVCASADEEADFDSLPAGSSITFSLKPIVAPRNTYTIQVLRVFEWVVFKVFRVEGACT